MPSSDKHHLPIKSLNNPKQKELLAHRATKVTHSVYDFGIQSDKNHLPIKSLNNPKQKEILAHRATKVRDKSHPLILAHRETKVTQSDKNHLPIKSLRLALNTRHTQSHGTEINLTKMPSSDKHHLPIKSLNNPKQKELLAHRATKVTHSERWHFCQIDFGSV